MYIQIMSNNVFAARFISDYRQGGAGKANWGAPGSEIEEALSRYVFEVCFLPPPPPPLSSVCC
jgi:hypothetical protein